MSVCVCLFSQVGVQQRMTDLEERLDTVVLALGDLGPFEGGPEPQVSYVPGKLWTNTHKG